MRFPCVCVHYKYTHKWTFLYTSSICAPKCTKHCAWSGKKCDSRHAYALTLIIRRWTKQKKKKKYKNYKRWKQKQFSVYYNTYIQFYVVSERRAHNAVMLKYYGSLPMWSCCGIGTTRGYILCAHPPGTRSHAIWIGVTVLRITLLCAHCYL